MPEQSLSRCSELRSCRLWHILDATRHIAAPLGTDEILQKSLAAAVELFNADRGTVFLYDPQTNELYAKVTTGALTPPNPNGLPTPGDTSEVTLLRFQADRGIAGETARTRRLINVPDCYADSRFNPEIDRLTGYRTRSLLSIPLLGIDEALVGVLQLLNKNDGHFNSEDELIATILAAHCAVVLQRAMLLDEYVLKQRMARDLALAREIQLSTLPKAMPELDGYEFFAWSRPADETGGDIYDALSLGPEQAGFVIADATGHGVGPALSVLQFRAMYRMGMLLAADLGEVMAKINLQLNSDLPTGRFVTAFAGIVDGSRHRIHYHSAGQAPLIHYQAGPDHIEWLEASALPLALLPHPPMAAPEPVELAPGDIFALISDGLFEFSNGEGEEFGRERVAGLIRSHRRQSLEAVCRELHEAVYAFGAGSPQADDMTILLVRRNR